MTTDKNSIIILILNYNSWQATVDYILMMRKQQEVQLSFLVVDNCSPDDSYSKLCAFYKDADDVEVLKSDYNGGYAYGNNYGLKHLAKISNEDTFILISNNDIVVDSEILLKRLIENYFRCKDIAFISPVMHTNNKPAPNCAWKIPGLKYDITTVVGFNRAKANESIYYDLPSHQNHLCVDCLSGSFFMGKLNTFIQLDYFDERTFLFEEERILAQKIKNAGLSNYLALNLKFHHLSSVIIKVELDDLKRLNYLLKSRVVFHQYFAQTNTIQLTLLKLFYATYLGAKRMAISLKSIGLKVRG